MPTINFKISDDAMSRKKDLRKTHPQIYLAGLMAYEGNLDLSKLEKPPKKKPKPKKGEIKLFITHPKTKELYEFHVLRNNRFELAEFKDIQQGETFRMMDNGKIVTCEGWRYFSYYDYAYGDKNNMVWVMCTGISPAVSLR